MKRLGLCVVLAAAFLLAGCGTSLGQTAVSQAQEQPVTLTWMMPQTHYRGFVKDLLEKFEAEYPSIRIEVQVIPDNQWTTLVKTKTAVGETPDMIRIDRELIVDIGPEHFVEFGSEQPWYSRVLPEQLENKKIDGKLYGLPVGSTSSLGLIYNRQLFEQYGISLPSNFEELCQVCEEFKAEGITPLYASDKDSWTTQIAFNVAFSQVASPETWEQLQDGSLRWSDVPEFEQALEDIASLRTRGYTNPDYLTTSYESAVNAMARGEVAMFVSGQFFVNDVQVINPDADLMMVPLPYQKDILTIVQGPGQISVFRDSPNREQAEIFLNWFSQAENMDVFNKGWNHMPVYRDQQLQLNEWQQNLYENYMKPGKTVLQVVEQLAGIDFNDLWSYQQEMLAGTITARQALEKWDDSFSSQLQAMQRSN